MEVQTAAGEFALPSEQVGTLRVSRFPNGIVDPSCALICVPGYGATGESFARLAPLAERFDLRLLTPPEDAPADPVAHYGGLVASFARRFQRPVLLGTSFGGPIALRAAADLGDAIAGIALVSTYAVLHHPLRRFIPILAWLEAAATLLQPLGVYVVVGKGLDRAAAHELLRETNSVSRREKHLRLVAALTCDLEPAAAQIDVPSLVVHGTRDRVVPIRAGRALARVLPRAEYHEIPGAGHTPYLTHAPELIAILARFLRREMPWRPDNPVWP